MPPSASTTSALLRSASSTSTRLVWHLLLGRQQFQEREGLGRNIAVRLSWLGRVCAPGTATRLWLRSSARWGAGVGVTVASAFGNAADSGAAVGVPAR